MTETPNLKMGDIVVLKTGSPHLMITRNTEPNDVWVECSYWCEDNGIKYAEIMIKSLETVQDSLIRESRLQLMSDTAHLPAYGDASTSQHAIVIHFDTKENMEAFIHKMDDGEPEVMN